MPCSYNGPAQPLGGGALDKLQEVCPQLAAESEGNNYCCTEEQLEELQVQIQMASIFLIGCPACDHNFKHFFCLMTCSPDQATFTNITAMQPSPDHPDLEAVAEMAVYVDAALGEAMFDSCKDVVYAVANEKAMKFVGGGANNYREWFEFIGLVKDKRFPPTGSPFQIDFPEEDLSGLMSFMMDHIPGCGDPGSQTCSCGDCPSAPGCSPPPSPPPPHSEQCMGLKSVHCTDIFLAIIYCAAVASLPMFVSYTASQQQQQQLKEGDGGEQDQQRPGSPDSDILLVPTKNQTLSLFFKWAGSSAARKPVMTLAVSACLVIFCAFGLARLEVMTDPEELWVGPGSRAALEKRQYESSFGPFYRITQLVISTTADSNGTYITPSGLPSILSDDSIELLFDIQDEVAAVLGEGNVTLQDVCLTPLLNGICATQSILQYWRMDRSIYEKGDPTFGRIRPEFCFSHWSTQCRSAFGGPIDPRLVLGGFDVESFRNYTADSTALIVTLPLRSDLKESSAAWEAEFIGLAEGKLTSMVESRNLRLSFSTERSVADELSRESTADVKTVALSYIFMLAYIALALGKIDLSKHWKTAFIYSRFGLGFGGVLVVASSVVGALGLCGWFHIKSTLIIMEVIPFLVLAIGVDNMFIVAQAVEDADWGGQHGERDERIGDALAVVGPSMTLAAFCEVTAFALGAMASMPALQNFAMCAALAVAINFLLQISAFPALLALDSQRIIENRLDLWPMMSLNVEETWYSGDEEMDEMVDHSASSNSVWSIPRCLRWYMATIHAPFFIQRPTVKAIVLAVFIGIFFASLAVIPRLQRGLDQAVALPRDSYLQDYYHDALSLLRVGPPVLFVLNNFSISSQFNEVCSIAGCNQDSMLNSLSAAANAPWKSYLATPASAWVDDYLSWVSPEVPQCCRRHASDGSQCPPPDQAPCNNDPQSCRDCTACFRPGDFDGRPSEAQVEDTLPLFLNALPSAACAKGGAVYADSFMLLDNNTIAGLDEGVIRASAFRASHTPLGQQKDFIGALQESRNMVEDLRERIGLDVYAYSVFHIFFEQYLTIVGEATVLLGSAAAAVFLACLLATGSAWAACLLLSTLGMMLVDLAGCMWLFGIQLNAVSVVNLVMAVGIGVEFVAHILHAFLEEKGSPEDRAVKALVDVGATVLTGITLTKVVGVSVLAFAHTMIFEVYYFKFYLSLVLVGASHGLIFLPCVLSSIGAEATINWRVSKAWLIGNSQ